MTQELFYAIKDKGAFLNEKKIQVSSKDEIMKAFGATGFPYLVQKNVKKSLNPIEHMLKKGIPLRRLGSACLDLAYTAASRFDLFFESYLEPWDFAAGSLLVKEAGGTITDFENKIIPIFQASSIAASNGHLHKSLMKELQG